jgi:polygalacturonase
MSHSKNMSTGCLFTAALLILCGACVTLQEPLSAHYPPNAEAVQEVLSGKRTVANARWWGFDAEDATECLQAAINSGARTVTVPYMGHDWIVRPITLRSNQEIIFEPGVVVQAKKGEFKGRNDSLFFAAGASDITLRGYGATLRMRKKDYMTSEYTKAEWRMVLRLLSCKRVTVLGLNLESSGGDGIYIGVSGDTQRYCEDIVIRDVTCYDNYRQGISVISAVNLLIENCVLANTWGTPPGAGIDLEPNHASEKLVNCVIRNCVMENNEGAGMFVYLKNLSRESDPVSIRFENCYVPSGKDVGIGVGAAKDDGPEGLILFENCTVENAAKGGIFVYDKSADSVAVRFVNCNWNNVGTAQRRSRAPLQISLLRASLTQKLGGIEFVDCFLYDNMDRPALVVQARPELGIHDIKGQITVRNPHGARMELPSKQVGVDLNIIETTQ